jgi:Domain of unknown function DUF302
MIGPERRLAGNLNTDGQVGFALSADRQRPARPPIITRAARTGPVFRPTGIADRHAVRLTDDTDRSQSGEPERVPRQSREFTAAKGRDPTTSRALVIASCATDRGLVEDRFARGHGWSGQLFARIDHAAGARTAEVELEANVLLIFGNTRVGTPLMQADPRVGIELPLRMLIWQDSDGAHVGCLDPRELADRYALDGHQQTLERQTAVLTVLAAVAAG